MIVVSSKGAKQGLYNTEILDKYSGSDSCPNHTEYYDHLYLCFHRSTCSPWISQKGKNTDSTSNKHGLRSNEHPFTKAGDRRDLALASPSGLQLRNGTYLFSSSSFLTRSFSSPIANTRYLCRRQKSMLLGQGSPPLSWHIRLHPSNKSILRTWGSGKAVCSFKA